MRVVLHMLTISLLRISTLREARLDAVVDMCCHSPNGDLSEDEMYVIGTVSSQVCRGLHADVVAWQHLHPDGSWTREKTRNAMSMFDENK